MICDWFLYQPRFRAAKENGGNGVVAPEYRLYPAMTGSFGLPIGLFWFAWTAREGVSWASPIVAAIPFAWGNMSVFIGKDLFNLHALIKCQLTRGNLAGATYLIDTYQALNGASAVAANGLLRYTLGGIFPLFTIQMYTNLGIAWATSLLGFVTVALLPIPWVLFKYGHQIRARSTYPTIKV
jgi:hypothetical protein